MQRPLSFTIIDFSQRNARTVIIGTLVITLVLGFFALQVRMDTDFNRLLPEDEEITLLIDRYGQGLIATDYLMLAFEREDIFDIEALQVLDRALTAIDGTPWLHTAVTPFSLFTFEDDGKKLDLVPVSPSAKAPTNAAELELFRKRISSDPIAQNIVISEDRSALFAIFPMDVRDGYESMMREVETILEPVRRHFTVYVSGTVAVELTAKKYLTRDFSTLIFLACAFILLLYYAGFRAKRAVFLPIAVVGIGTIWCIGFMGIMGYSISIISIVIPPLVLTLGSSYSIHILNQYYREAGSNGDGGVWITGAVTHIGKTIILASLTTIVGFLSLLSARTPQAREFGIASGVGIASCAVLSLFLLPAALSFLKKPTAVQRRRVTEGPLARFMSKLGQWVVRGRFVILGILVLICIAFSFSINRIHHQLDYLTYFPENSDLVSDMNFIIEKVGGLQQIQLTLSVEDRDEKNFFLDRSVLEDVSRLESLMRESPNIVNTRSFVSYLEYLNALFTGEEAVPKSSGLILLLSRYFKAIDSRSDGENFISTLANQDFTYLTITFKVYDTVNNRYLFEDSIRTELNRIRSLAEEILGDRVEIAIWGNSMRLISLADILRHDLRISMIISILVILVITTVSFRSFKYGAAALIPLITGIMLNFTFMYLFRIPMDMTTMMVSSVAIGVGVDSAIHFLLQFRKQLSETPKSVVDSITRTLEITGRPILLTTFSVVGGLLVLCLASFKPIIYFGLLVSTALLTTALGTIIILPVILAFAWSVKGRRKIV